MGVGEKEEGGRWLGMEEVGDGEQEYQGQEKSPSRNNSPVHFLGGVETWRSLEQGMDGHHLRGWSGAYLLDILLGISYM